MEYRIGKKVLNGVVLGFVKKGLVKDRKFSYQRKLYLVDYLNREEGGILDFVKSKGEVDYSVLLKRFKIDDDVLTRIGKKLVRMGLIVKVGRGYKTYFVLRERFG